MTSIRKTLAVAFVASMVGMGGAFAQTDPAPAAPAAGDTMAAPAPDAGAMPMKKPMKKKMMKKKMMKKKMMKKM